MDLESLLPLLIPILLSVPFLLWGQKGIHPVTRCAKSLSWVKGIAAGCDSARLLSLDNPYGGVAITHRLGCFVSLQMIFLLDAHNIRTVTLLRRQGTQMREYWTLK